MSLAPIILFVYNRPDYTLQTLTALMANELAQHSVLYIYSDGPKSNASKSERQKIDNVRKTIRQKQWCKEVIVIERDKNFGLAKSVIKGVTQTVNKYGKVIVLEDDIITASGFLRFMNNALNVYEREEEVFGISGFCYPLKRNIDQTTYVLPIGCSWSWATWKNSWRIFEPNSEVLLNEIIAKNLKHQFNFNGYNFFRMLKQQVKKKNDSWAIRFYASFFLKNGRFIFPNKSLVQNIGFGEYSTHTKGKGSIFERVLIQNDSVRVKKEKIEINKALCDLIILKQSLAIRFLTRVRSVIND